jgi:AcrR family transcriptional regulator
MYDFQWNGARVYVRQQSGMDMMRARVLLRKLAPAATDPDFEVWLQVYLVYAQIATQIERVEGTLDMTFPPIGASADEHRVAAETLMAQPAELVAQLERALDAANAPPGDPDLAPPETLDVKKKAN